MSDYKLSHLQELEAESIHIIREVAAEFENPVMLYSIGKDSSVMVRLAEKAFAPGKVPFPLMHIDSKWKFKEMIEFRDSYAKARKGEIKEFTGVSAPFEAPERPDLSLDTSVLSVEQSVSRLLELIIPKVEIKH